MLKVDGMQLLQKFFKKGLLTPNKKKIEKENNVNTAVLL